MCRRPELEKLYNFTQLAVELNEMEDGVAPTDSRHRPDQRLMEEGRWDEANTTKLQLEEKQRTARKQREQEIAEGKKGELLLHCLLVCCVYSASECLYCDVG